MEKKNAQLLKERWNFLLEFLKLTQLSIVAIVPCTRPFSWHFPISLNLMNCFEFLLKLVGLMFSFNNEKKFFVLNNDDREENIFLLQIGDVKNLYKNWLNCFQQTNWRISVHYQEQYQDFFRKKRKFERWQELYQSFHLINDLQNAINCLLSSREMLKKEEATLYKTSSQWDIHIESTKNKEEEAITSKSIDIHKGDQEKNYQQKLTSPLDEDVSSNWYGKVRL